MADKEILIFVEGPSDKIFLEVYLYFLEYFPIKNFKVRSINGKCNLSSHLNEIEQYAKTLIIFDADKDYESNKKEILKVVSKTQQKITEEQIFLFPNNQDDGDLETLLLEIAKHKEIIQCFKRYLKCIECKCIGIKEHHGPIKNIRKNMLYAYLEVFELQKFFQYKWDTSNKNEKYIIIDDKGKIKERYKEEYEKLKEVIDFNSKSLIPLKNFLEKSTENKQKTKLKIF
ncbi:hypothetical protein KVD47_04830 [Helicobacter pylori]|uniref:DUF3226 domain-containing protein n=1 Tax=Helicobacter pylori TaxID=210 RepID=UPI000C31632B|nr:DUF3226 domain-containing protein [Helicobacter pylori]WRA50323.1 hypothetical protein KVL22_04835 [Helicobacter pylori]WRE48373.1 hypothetical protein KVD47_04830 [Helicobacter pylori]